MAELKTYRCDVCQDVYHSDKDRIKISINVEKADEPVKVYDHICPTCACSLHSFVKDPSQFDKLIVEKKEAERHAYALEDTIKTLRDTVCGWKCWQNYLSIDNSIEYCKELASDVKNQYKKVLKQRDIWVAIGGVFFGVTLGLFFNAIF